MVVHWRSFVTSKLKALLEAEGPTDAVIATTSTLAAFDECPRQTAKIALIRAYENFGWRCPWVPRNQRINLIKLAAVRRFQDKRMIDKADIAFTNSAFMQEAISSRFGVDSNRIEVLLQACNVAPAQYAAPPKTVGFVARGPEKGLSFVLELARQSPDLRYLIYGHGEGLPSSLPQNVEWQGWAANRDDMFASAALWIVPSLWAEPFGRVSIEAQAANRAVLVADKGGLPETVRDDKFRINGFNAEKWLARIRELLELPPDVLQANGAHIRTAFSPARHDSRVLAAMERAASANNGVIDA